MLDEIGGPVQAIHPIVISGYDISASYSDEVDPDDELDVEIDVTPTALEDDPADVEVVFWNDDTVERIDATGSDGEYSASIDLDELDLDEYNIHVAALGEDEFRGRQEILGLSDQGTIEITESGSEIEDGGDGGSAGGPVNGGQPVSDGDDPANETDSDPEVDNGNETDVGTDESAEIVELIDEAPDSAGIQVSFENTTTVRTLTLLNESASGNVTVENRSTLPTYTDSPSKTPVAIVQITVPDAVRSSSAILELAVDEARVNESENLTIERYDSANNTWANLETTASATSDTEITVTAETPGFSIFAVTEPDTESSSPSNESESDGVETETETDSTPVMPTETEEPSDPEDQPGFGVLPVLVALLALLSGFFYRNNR